MRWQAVAGCLVVAAGSIRSTSLDSGMHRRVHCMWKPEGVCMIFVSVYTSLLFAVLWWNHNVNCAIQECSLVVAALLQHLYLVITHHLIFARALPSLARSRFGLKDLLHPMNLPFKL